MDTAYIQSRDYSFKHLQSEIGFTFDAFYQELCVINGGNFSLDVYLYGNDVNNPLVKTKFAIQVLKCNLKVNINHSKIMVLTVLILKRGF